MALSNYLGTCLLTSIKVAEMKLQISTSYRRTRHLKRVKYACTPKLENKYIPATKKKINQGIHGQTKAYEYGTSQK